MAINYHGEIALICPRITSNDFKEEVSVYWKMSIRCPNQIKWLINIQMNLSSGFITLSDKTVYINDLLDVENMIQSFTYDTT